MKARCLQRSDLENLVSLSDLTAKGSTVKLSNSGGVISNPVNEKEIHMKRDYGTWRLKLDDLATYDHEQGDQVNAFYSVLPKTKAERFISLHERLGHQPAKVLAEMLNEDNPLCIRAGITAREVKEIGGKYTCIACLMSKRRSQSVAFNLSNPDGFQGEISSKTAIPGQIISLDPVGPISPKSIGGFTLMWLVYDIGSGYQWVYFSKSKEAAVIIQILELVLADLIFYGKELKIVRSDAEEIFSSMEVISFLQSKGVKSQFSVPYQHHQNRVERAIQHLVRGVSTLMHSQKFLPISCWEYAAKHMVKILRYVPTKKTKPDTPRAV